MAKALKKPRKKANGYKMPDPLPEGAILTDIAKNSWRLGSSIGKGGFGEIYLAQEAASKSSKYPAVIKVEPHGNGPLFVEMHFYMKNAKKADIEAFMKKHKLKTFGMPVYLGSGSHEDGAMKFRFIVMEKFGSDIEKIRAENKGALAPAAVFQLAWQITYVLEYIHDFGYVHADIKGGNVLLGSTAETKDQAYLLDFGLATKYTTQNEFKPNPKKAHDGTIEYLSRDAHHGVPTRRGDFEILGYNIIHWLGGSLPWDSKLDDPKKVQELKEEGMADIPRFVRTCLKKNQETVVRFLEYVDSLKFNEKPDYKKISALLEQEVKKHGASVSGPLELNTSVRKRRSGGDADFDEKKVVGGARKKEKKEDNDDVMNDEMKEILNKKTARKKQKGESSDGSAEVMTEAMKEVLARKKEKEGAIKKKVPRKNGAASNENFEGYNDEMLEIKKKIMEKPKKEAQKTAGRSLRNLPVVNYDERTPRPPKKKY